MTILVNKFNLKSPYPPAGDQAKVISEITSSIAAGNDEQTILGVTGSGKTFMMASIVNNLQRPTLVIAHNKTLAAQLAEEFSRFFPDNAVHYFVSYYDYFQPESYVPSSDTYIEKQTEINEEIDRLRNAATASLMTRKDVLIVASVSCIYGLGSVANYTDLTLDFELGKKYKLSKVASKLINMVYTRTPVNVPLTRSNFMIKGEVLEVIPSGEEEVVRFSFWGDELESIERINHLTREKIEDLQAYKLFPATQYATSNDSIKEAKPIIEADMEKSVEKFIKEERYIEAQRLKERVSNDLEMLTNTGFVNGIENYSRYFDGRRAGDPSTTLLDYFPDDSICFIDESHMTLPQIGAMYHGDRRRKTTLVEYGFRLRSALDNRPLKIDEFFEKSPPKVYVSATPGPFELGQGPLPMSIEAKEARIISEMEESSFD